MKRIIITVVFLLGVFLLGSAQGTIKRTINNSTTATGVSKQVSTKPVYKAIDLGLPSGIKWADRNVGAKSPQAYGDLFRFGNPKSSLAKSGEGWCDISNIIGTEYDIAKVKMGNQWRTPSSEQFRELINYCTFTEMKIKDAVFAKVIGPNGNSMYMPLAGVMYGYGRSQGGQFGIYQAGDRPYDGKVYELWLWPTSSGLRVSIQDNGIPGDGCPVRGVCK